MAHSQSNHESTLFRKFAALSVLFDADVMSNDRYGWIEAIEDAVLYEKLHNLSKKDLELITLVAMENYSQAEVAQIRGCSRSAITQRIQRIRRFLK